MLSPGVSVVVPVYRSASILPELLARLEKVLPGCAPNYELIFVCDGGAGDECREFVSRQSQSHPRLRGLVLANNYGQHAATLAGIRAAGYDRIVTLDDDLQHPPESIPGMLGQLADDADVVYGKPIKPMGSAPRAFASSSFRNLIKGLSGIAHTSDITAFRVFRTALRERFAGRVSSFVSVDLLLAWATTRVVFCPIYFDLRKAGQSNYNFRKLIAMALAWIFAANPRILWWSIGLSAGWSVLVAVMLVHWIGQILTAESSLVGEVLEGMLVLAGVSLLLGMLFAVRGFLRQRRQDSLGALQILEASRINFSEIPPVA